MSSVTYNNIENDFRILGKIVKSGDFIGSWMWLFYRDGNNGDFLELLKWHFKNVKSGKFSGSLKGNLRHSVYTYTDVCK